MARSADHQARLIAVSASPEGKLLLTLSAIITLQNNGLRDRRSLPASP